MKLGIERLLSEPALRAPLQGRRVALLAHPASVTRDLTHSIDALSALPEVRLSAAFGPQHGLRGDKQDNMVESPNYVDPRWGIPIFSLYGEVRRPTDEMMDSFDVLLVDLQDLGCRIYTFITTLRYVLEAAAAHGKSVWVLDRPNPAGRPVEGLTLQPGWESFVGAGPMPMRHGMTMGELGTYFRDRLGIRARLEVVRCEGWARDAYFDETGLPWVYPSPNMPTLDTAVLYPGMCLIEGTNLSEGRGTTRPFHLVGAPWLDAARFTELCRMGALDNELRGVAFRAATFEPRFQKFAGETCHGVEVTVTDRHALDALLLGLVVLEAALRAAPDAFRWRTETYEFVDDPIAIDLLCGSAEARVALESRVRPRDLVAGWAAERAAWDEEHRQPCLLY